MIADIETKPVSKRPRYADIRESIEARETNEAIREAMQAQSASQYLKSYEEVCPQ